MQLIKPNNAGVLMSGAQAENKLMSLFSDGSEYPIVPK
jgi:hypothetical protein